MSLKIMTGTESLTYVPGMCITIRQSQTSTKWLILILVSMRAIIRDLGVSDKLICDIISNNLRFKSNCLKNCQFIVKTTSFPASSILQFLKVSSFSNILPGSSSDYNLLDYFICYITDTDVNRHHPQHNSVNNCKDHLCFQVLGQGDDVYCLLEVPFPPGGCCGH